MVTTMAAAPPTFDAERIRTLLKRAGELAVARNSALDLLLLGGAAIALLFESRRTTRDIDVLEVRPSRELLSEISTQIAGEENLPTRWLNDDAARFARGVVAASRGQVLFDAPGIRVQSVTLEQLLASKLDAMRDDVDRADAVTVAGAMGLSLSSTELAIAPYLRTDRYERACQELQDIWSEVEDARR